MANWTVVFAFPLRPWKLLRNFARANNNKIIKGKKSKWKIKKEGEKNKRL
jgi:hypothetical protein